MISGEVIFPLQMTFNTANFCRHTMVKAPVGKNIDKSFDMENYLLKIRQYLNSSTFLEFWFSCRMHNCAFSAEGLAATCTLSAQSSAPY